MGRQAILALNRYLEKQKLAEQLPDAQRREELSYDTALTRLSKSVCPGCERAVDLKDTEIDFCPHCGNSADHGAAREDCRDTRARDGVLVADRTAVDADVEEIRSGRPAVAGDIGAECRGPLTARACGLIALPRRAH